MSIRGVAVRREAFEPMPAGDPFGDLINAPAKYVVSRTLERPIWRNTTILRGDPVEEVRRFSLKAVTPYPTGVVGLDYTRQGQAS